MTYKLPATWSSQQQAFIDELRDGHSNIVLEAVAGSGKTTTILGAVTQIPHLKTAILAYNTKIADEIKSKLIKLGIDWKVARAGTVHSFGFAALRKTFGDIKVDEKKVLQFIAPGPYDSIIKSMVSLAKQRALGVIDRIHDMGAWRDIINHFDLIDDENPVDTEDLISEAITALKKSNAQTNVIDFDDMVYLPLVHPVKFFRYDVVIIDEAQDTNPARRELAKRLIAPRGRLVAVGDHHQAIYGFTGADNDSLQILQRNFNAKEMPLTVTYRCPKVVVDFARQWVSHITAADTAIDGEVLDAGALIDITPEANSMILCRNTKPLVSAAFSLLRRRIPCKIEGRDIGKGLIKLARKWSRIKTIEGYHSKLDSWIADRRAQDEGRKLEMFEDQYATMLVIMEQCAGKDRQALVDTIESLFADDVKGVIILSTIHKAKGREAKVVYWLNRRTTCPSKYAKQEWEQLQEINLQYVCCTRAQNKLIEVTV